MTDIFFGRRPPSNAHHHELKAAAMVARGEIPSVGAFLVDISHDVWCDMVANRGFCNCAPEIVVRKPEGLSS